MLLVPPPKSRTDADADCRSIKIKSTGSCTGNRNELACWRSGTARLVRVYSPKAVRSFSGGPWPQYSSDLRCPIHRCQTIMIAAVPAAAHHHNGERPDGRHQIKPVFRCKIPNFYFFRHLHAWRFKSRRNKKRIVTATCKSRDESNEPN